MGNILSSALQQAMNAVQGSRFNLVAQAKAIPEYVNLLRNGVQTPNYIPTPEERDARRKQILTDTIRNRLVQYGGEDLPALEYVPQFVEATQKYDFFKNNPYLLPQLSILETSGGKNVSRPNNILNWGIGIPENNEAFAQMTPQEVLERAISGLGERSSYYSQFRTGKPLTQPEMSSFGSVYNPPNPNYGNDIWSGIQQFLPE